MITTYTYSLSTDFSNSLNRLQFHNEITDSSISTTLIGINTNADVVDVVFESALSGADQTALNSIVSGHTVDPLMFADLNFKTISSSDSPYYMRKKSLYCDTSSGNITVNLPKAGRANGVYFAVKKTSASNTVTLSPEGSSLIDGASSKTLTSLNETLIFYSDGTNWILSSNADPYDSFYYDASRSLTDIKGEIVVDSGTEQLPLSVGSDGQVLKVNSAVDAGIEWANESGEANTTSSSGGTSLVKTKVGTDLPFKGLTATSSKIALASNTNDIGIDVTEANVVHDNLSGAGTNTHAQIDSHLASTSNPHSVTKAQVGLTNVEDLKVKLDGTAAPTVNDDTSLGYVVGSRWIDVTGNKEYVCLDNTDGAAVWTETTQSASSTIGSYGSLYMENNSTITTINTSGVHYKILGTTTAGPLSGFTHANNKLTYTGTTTTKFLAVAAGTLECESSDKDCGISIHKNGTSIGAPNRDNIGNSKFGNSSVNIITELSTNDYIEVYTFTYEDNEYVIVKDLNLSIASINTTGSDGAAGAAGATGATGADGDMTWQGAWVSQNYTVNQTVSYSGSGYVCKLNTTSSQVPTNTTYWDLLVSKGDTGSGGASHDIISLHSSTSYFIAIASDTYTTISQFIYGGTNNVSSIQKIYITCRISGASYGKCRILDSTNNNTIAEDTYINHTSMAINDLGNVSNLPTEKAMFEIQLYVYNPTVFRIYASSLYIEY